MTPKIDARGDVEKYASSCRILENMLPMIHGGATTRPGTEYIATAHHLTTPVRLIPFVYSADIAYQCEFGSGYIRFYYDGEPLMDGLTVVNVETPYAASDLAAMQYKQIGDVMCWCTAPTRQGNCRGCLRPVSL